MKIQLKPNLLNKRWHCLFVADEHNDFNPNTTSYEAGHLLDDFCRYCNYTIVSRASKTSIVIRNNLRTLNVAVKFEKGGSVRVTYSIVGLSLVSLDVVFKEINGYMHIESDVSAFMYIISLSLINKVATGFVKDAHYAFSEFMKHVN